MAQLRSVTCHMGSHSVTCLPTQVNTPHLNPSHTGRYSIYLPRRDGRLSWPSWLDSAPAGSRTSDLSITSVTLNHCTAKTRCTDHVFQGVLSHLCPKKIFDSARNTAMLICKITLPESPHPIIISKNAGFRALHLAWRNKFHFFSFSKY